MARACDNSLNDIPLSGFRFGLNYVAKGQVSNKEWNAANLKAIWAQLASPDLLPIRTNNAFAAIDTGRYDEIGSLLPCRIFMHYYAVWHISPPNPTTVAARDQHSLVVG